jgi:hypothetical protein
VNHHSAFWIQLNPHSHFTPALEQYHIFSKIASPLLQPTSLHLQGWKGISSVKLSHKFSAWSPLQQLIGQASERVHAGMPITIAARLHLYSSNRAENRVIFCSLLEEDLLGHLVPTPSWLERRTQKNKSPNDGL